jgi:hypothetical protein
MFSRGIVTYAVGLPGSNTAATFLNALASAGGTGSYLSPRDSTELEQALSTIASNTIDRCTITLTPPPPDPAKVYLMTTTASKPDGESVPQSATNGWSLSADGSTATLEGTVCANAKAGAYATLEFVYGCPALPSVH